MTEHYYSKNPQVTSQPRKVNFMVQGQKLVFQSDSGVFSKREIDFGTRLLIETFQIEKDINGSILDVGCGYGPIGISVAAMHAERTVHMVDINDRAIALATVNAKINHTSNLEIYSSNLYQAVKQTAFAAILSNPPIRAGKQVVHEILIGAHDKLAKGGVLWVVIQKKQGAPSALARMEEVFDNAKIIVKKKGYWIMTASKLV